MSKQLKETFTNDLRYNEEVVSIEELDFELSDEDIKKPYFDKEELDVIWKTLRQIYNVTDDHYIIMYLIYYLGFSYRKTGAVVGRVPSLVFLYEAQAIHAVRVLMGIDIISEKDPREIQTAVRQALNINYIGFPLRDKNGKVISRPTENTPRKIKARLQKKYAEEFEA